jgi:hypothetical protein
MKKVTGILAIILAVFSMLYLSNTAFADKAAISVGPNKMTVDVSLGTGAGFIVSDLDNALSLRIEVKPVGSGSYQTVTGLSNISATGTYTRTALEMQSQFGNGSFTWKAVDNGSSSHESAEKELEIQD